MSKVPSPREGDSPFLVGTTMQFAWDSTSLGMLKECPKKYEYAVIDGWRGAGTANVHLLFGTVFHKALELYDHHKIDKSHDEAELEAVRYAMEVTCEWESLDSKKNRDTLIRSIVWYLETYKDDQAKTVILNNGQPAVELSFRFETDLKIDGQPIFLCGHLDRVVDFGGTIFIQDRKTTGSTIGPYFFVKFNPDNQMSLYTLAGRIIYNIPISGVMIDAAQIAVGFTAFGRAMTMRSEAQLEEWLEDFYHWVRTAKSYADAGHYPRNEMSCDKYGGCQFRHVCSADPSVRQNFLEGEFTKADPWNPLKTRGKEDE